MRVTVIHHMLLLFVVIFSSSNAHAQFSRENAITAQLIAENENPGPGETVTLAIRMSPDPGWHGYWLNPGEAGLPDRWQWQLPEGAAIGPLRYPVPDTLMIADIMNYVYESDYAMLAEFQIPEDAVPGSVLPIRAQGEWLACTDEICVPESGAVSLALTVGNGPVDAGEAAFDGYRRALPRPLDSPARYAVSGDLLRLAIPFPADARVSEPYFFAETDGVLDYGAEQRISRNGDFLIVEVAAEANAATAGEISGLLKIGAHEGLWIAAQPGSVPVAGEPVSARDDSAFDDAGAILLAIGGAVLGGLLLNIMPCVFPILSLKALSLAKAGADEGTARRDAMAYGAGSIAMCVALGAALLVLRSSGEAVGWAFQLQDPRSIVLLMLLTAAIALNLVGLFELPGLAIGSDRVKSGGRTGSFFTGALAGFVATPCTGPFMAAALGAALVLPAVVALAIFAGLGLGLALPFLVIAFFPAVRSRLPKPGPWMVRFRHILALPMALTALALLWVLWRQTGSIGLWIGIAATALLTLFLWWMGRRQRGGRSVALPAAAIAPLLLGTAVALPGAAPPAVPSTTLPGAESFSQARLAALRADGRPVFVYFTADWCITCKANEAGALASDTVAAHFAEQDIAVLVGDWTTGDPAIGRFLADHGRSGVPLYLYYAPGEEAEILPQILTPSRLSVLGA